MKRTAIAGVKLLIGASLTSWSGALIAQNSCIRHFNNRSSFEWSITDFAGPQSRMLIAPNTTVEIPYVNATSITISINDPTRPYTRTYQLQATADGCYVLSRKRHPGLADVNEPNPGDIVTCAGGC